MFLSYRSIGSDFRVWNYRDEVCGDVDLDFK